MQVSEVKIGIFSDLQRKLLELHENLAFPSRESSSARRLPKLPEVSTRFSNQNRLFLPGTARP